jgi:hypothetical protein
MQRRWARWVIHVGGAHESEVFTDLKRVHRRQPCPVPQAKGMIKNFTFSLLAGRPGPFVSVD